MNLNPPAAAFRERLTGALIGTAVGDALGLPAENLSAGRIQRLWKGNWKMRFFLGKGMVSDDTEHTLMVAQALLSESKDAARFQRILAWKLRWWLASLPGGVGMATGKACLKLWAGLPPTRSAVCSAGSGPAMRSAILGAFFCDSPESRREFVLASSRLTHRSWQAEVAALAVAECAAAAVKTEAAVDPFAVVASVRCLSSEPEWSRIITTLDSSLRSGHSVSEFARGLGLDKGVLGYALHVVPVAIYAWLRHPSDFHLALTSALNCGGDTDTVGAILGSLAGATAGVRCIPEEWVNSIWDWPRSVTFMGKVAGRLENQTRSSEAIGPAGYFWPAVIPRNLFFLAIVLTHGFRRLAPPY